MNATYPLRSRLAPILLAALALSLGAESAPAATLLPGAAAPANGEAANGEEAGDGDLGQELPPPVEEAQGTCETPRQAWLQLLFWLGNETRDPARAKECFDAEHLTPEEAQARAVELHQVLEARGWLIRQRELPTDPDYVDPDTGTHIYEAPAVEGRGLYVERQDDRWLFPRTTLERVPELYPDITRRILAGAPAWLRVTVLGIEVWQYLGVLILILIALAAQAVVAFIINAYLRRLVEDKSELDRAIRRAEQPLGGLAMAAAFYLGFPALLFPGSLSQIAMVGAKALAALSLVWLGFRVIDVVGEWMAAKAAKTESKLDEQVVPLLRKTFKIVTAVIGGLFVLQNLDVDVSSLLAGLGLGGLAFALAARDTIANFFGSVMIFVDKPFQLGDWVVIGEVEGVVEEVGFRTTKVRTFYDSLVTVPNANVVNQSVDNYGLRNNRRYFTTLHLHLETPPDKVEEFCEAVRQIIRDTPEMYQDLFMIELSDFGDSSLAVMVYTFIQAETWEAEMRTRMNLNLAILRAAERLGVRLALPGRALHVESLVNPGDSRPPYRTPNDRQGG